MMMVDNEELGLSLSLTCSKPNINRVNTSGSNRNISPIQLNLSSSSLSHANLPFALAWNDSVASSPDRASDAPCRAIGGGSAAAEARSFLIIGINANRQQAIAEDEEAGVSSPNSTISSVSGKRSEREAACAAVDEQDVDRTCSRGASDEEDADASRKKLRLSKDQSAVLEDSFKDNHTLNPKQKMALAKRLGLRPRQVEVWFQNRRARTKVKQTEFDCEFMRKCCEQLTEENRRLQKEVQELRALKLSPQFYMPMAPPTTLTVCPSCERVAPPSSAPAPTHVQRRLPANPWGVQIGQVES